MLCWSILSNYLTCLMLAGLGTVGPLCPPMALGTTRRPGWDASEVVGCLLTSQAPLSLAELRERVPLVARRLLTEVADIQDRVLSVGTLNLTPADVRRRFEAVVPP